MARAMGARAVMAAAWEATYGTTPASGFQNLPIVSSTLGAEQPLIASDLLGQGRDPAAPIRDAITVDGDVVVPIEARSIGWWLRGAFGNPTTTGSAPNFSHVFDSGNWTLPSMSIELQHSDVPAFKMHRGVRVGGLSWTMQRSGTTNMTVNLVGQGQVRAGSTAAGTPAVYSPLLRFGPFTGFIERDGSPLANIVSAEVNYSNGLDRVETIRADGLIDGVDPGMATCTGTIETRWADNVLLDDAINGTALALVFGYQISANVQLRFRVEELYLPRPRIGTPGPGGISATFNWQASRAAGPGRMVRVTLANPVASY